MRTALPMLALAVLALVGCGGEDGDDGRARPEPAPVESEAAPAGVRPALTVALRARDPQTERWADRATVRAGIPFRVRVVVRNRGTGQARALGARLRLPAGLRLAPLPVTVRTVRLGLGRPVDARRLLRGELPLGPLRAGRHLLLELTARADPGATGERLTLRAEADAPRSRARDVLEVRVGD